MVVDSPNSYCALDSEFCNRLKFNCLRCIEGIAINTPNSRFQPTSALTRRRG